MRKIVFIVIPALLVSCSTSSDPREGGLFGYLSTGDAGYQARVDNMQSQLSSVDAANDAEAHRSSALKSKRSSLQAQKAKLSSLKREAMAEPGNLGLVYRIQQAENGADSDPGLDAKIKQLEAEVRALQGR